MKHILVERTVPVDFTGTTGHAIQMESALGLFVFGLKD